MAKYTDAQIKTVCEAAINSIAGMTDAQNVTFPTTPIIEGMNAGLSAEVIASNARESISESTNTEALKVKGNTPCFKAEEMFVKRVSCKMIAENVREDRLRCFCSL
jgi:hypothetical protein